MKEKLKILTNGLIKENPSLRLVLGTCPTLAVTTLAVNGLGMGLAATFVLICSNVVISALRKVIPDKVRLPAYICDGAANAGKGLLAESRHGFGYFPSAHRR